MKKLTFLLPVSIIIFMISLYSMIVQTLLGDSPQIATVIGGILGMIGGIVGALGAYLAAKAQIDFQLEQIQIENKRKARPFIVCNDFHASYNLREVEVHADSKIIEFDYLEKMKQVSDILTNKRIPFFQLKFLGNPEVILECNLKLYLDNNYYEVYFYEAYLDHMKNDVDIFIPIPYVTVPNLDDARPEKLELYYTTVEQEKFLYVYNHSTKTEYLYEIKNEDKIMIKERKFLETTWILPGKRKVNNELATETYNKFHLQFQELIRVLEELTNKLKIK